MLDTLSIAKRILILTVGALILMLLITFLGWRGMQQMTDDLESVYLDRAVPMVDLSQIASKFDAVYADLLRAFQHDPDSKTYALHDHPISEHTERAERVMKEIDALWEKYMATTLTEEEKRLAADFAAKRARYDAEVIRPTLAALLSDDYSAPVQAHFLKGNRALGGETRQALADLIAYQARVAQEVYEEAERHHAQNLMLFAAFIVVGTLLLGMLGWHIARGISLSLSQAIGAAEAVAAGDLSSRLERRDAQDEASRLLAAMADMQTRLRAMVTDTQQSAERLARSAQELSTAAAQAASASEAQTESASGMAAAVEEMSVSIDQLRDHAHEAHSVASQSGEQSRSGGEVVHSAAGEIGKIADAVNTSAQVIRELEGTSNEISAIVNVIREIADQTNLLALNAAIEAARAGEQGRGFAVVADEVRKLAERTANSTQQIAGMIDKVQAGARRAAQEMETGVTRVTEGVSLAHQAGDSITGIQESASRVVSVVEDISSALREQSIASQEIAHGVERIAQMSEESSAAARRAADATQGLRQLAEELRASVAHFRV